PKGLMVAVPLQDVLCGLKSDQSFVMPMLRSEARLVLRLHLRDRRQLLPGQRSCAADDEFRFDRDRGWQGVGPGNAAQEGVRRDLSDFSQWLAHSGESRVLVGGTLNVIESYYRDVLWNSQAGFTKCADCANGGDIVKRKQCSERFSRCQQPARGDKAQVR